MGDVDAEMLLELLEMGQGDVRDMQLMALEQLCMTLLTSDNIDQCFERYFLLIPSFLMPCCLIIFNTYSYVFNWIQTLMCGLYLL